MAAGLGGIGEEVESSYDQNRWYAFIIFLNKCLKHYILKRNCQTKTRETGKTKGTWEGNGPLPLSLQSKWCLSAAKCQALAGLDLPAKSQAL